MWFWEISPLLDDCYATRQHKKIWYRWKPSGAKDWAKFVCFSPDCTAGGGGHRSTHTHTVRDFVYSEILQTNYSTQNITLNCKWIPDIQTESNLMGTVKASSKIKVLKQSILVNWRWSQLFSSFIQITSVIFFFYQTFTISWHLHKKLMNSSNSKLPLHSPIMSPGLLKAFTLCDQRFNYSCLVVWYALFCSAAPCELYLMFLRCISFAISVFILAVLLLRV